MNIRDLSIRDLVELEGKALFPVENLINKPAVLQKTFEDEFGLVGSVIINRTVELVAIFNDKRSTRDLYHAMTQIHDLLYKELVPLGYRDVHAFVRDPKFADILVKHFGFNDCKGRTIVHQFTQKEEADGRRRQG